MNSRKITLVNIICNLVLQIVTIISYFIIPKLILMYFGSEVNGLVSSINQFLNFITLVEGGITGVITANLYRPLIENDYEKLNSILSTANKFYKKISLIFIVYSIILSLIYPIIFKINFSFFYVFSLILILSLNFLFQYMFAITNKTLLCADKKNYIVSLTQSIMIILNIILVFISLKVYPNIHLLKLITGILFLLQPIVYSFYVNKHYKIKKNAIVDNELIKQRWDGFAINVAAFIHMSTDVVVLTIFTNMTTVSVYSVYTLVTSGLRQIISSVSSAIVPTIGQAYMSGNIKTLNEKMDLYEYIICILVFLMFSIAGLLITPFVNLYSRGINDANYNRPIFGILILLSEAIYLIKIPHLNLSYSANKFKEIKIPAFIETFLNMFVSILLVKKMGLLGVAIGTIIAMIYRMNFHIRFTNKIIKNRKPNIFYRKIFILLVSTIIPILISVYFFPIDNIEIYNWIYHAIIYILIFSCTYVITSLIFFKKEINYIKKYIK